MFKQPASLSLQTIHTLGEDLLRP